MILSHKYKFIFIKTNKTAGTSIEIALSKFCGEHDILTCLSGEDEQKRKKLGYRGPQNHLAPITEYKIKDFYNLFVKKQRKIKFREHISARLIREYIGLEMWNSYYKFCFERNPWERAISHYYWCYKTEPRPALSQYIRSNRLFALRKYGYNLYTIDNQIVVDDIYKYENIIDSIKKIKKIIGLSEDIELPNTKVNFREDKRSYNQIMSQSDIDYIKDYFKEEIELLNY